MIKVHLVSLRLSLLELEARRCYLEGDSCHPVNSPRRNVLQLSSAYQSGELHEVNANCLTTSCLIVSAIKYCALIVPVAFNLLLN